MTAKERNWWRIWNFICAHGWNPKTEEPHRYYRDVLRKHVRNFKYRMYLPTRIGNEPVVVGVLNDEVVVRSLYEADCDMFGCAV